MKVGLTGATGFLGSRLLPLLDDHDIHLTTMAGESLSSNYQLPTTKTLQTDLSSESPPADFYADIDILVHMVGSFSPDPKAMSILNMASLMYALAPLEKLASKPRVVFTSSCAVYGETPQGTASKETDPLEPSTPYGFAKLWCEQYLAWHSGRHGYETTVLRFPNIYGRGSQAVMAKFIERLEAGQPVQLDGEGNQVRDFLFVDDAAAGIASAINAGKNNPSGNQPAEAGVFNISTGVETTLRELLALLGTAMNVEPQIESRPVNPFTQHRIVLDPTKSERELQWKPTVGLEEGIEKVLRLNDQ